MAKKNNIGVLFKIGGFLAFLMLGYLGLRSYRASVEMLKSDRCINEIAELSMNIREKFGTKNNYADLNYTSAVSIKAIPKSMFKEGYKEALNSYMGGVDFWYSALSKDIPTAAFEISFQGLTKYGCMNLLRKNWGDRDGATLIAIAGYGNAQPAGRLDEVYPDSTRKDIKGKNIFLANESSYANIKDIENACNCPKDDCTVIWKFR